MIVVSEYPNENILNNSVGVRLNILRKVLNLQ